jgi:hypothetical protein
MTTTSEPTQADFVNACQLAADRLWMHRRKLRRAAVKIGFWPTGMVISANITARNDDEMAAALPPQVIPWDQVATISIEGILAIVDLVCDPLYPALGISREEKAPVAMIALGRKPEQEIWIEGLPAEDIGIPTVALSGYLEGLGYITPDRADAIADGLQRAARRARGEAAA